MRHTVNTTQPPMESTRLQAARTARQQYELVVVSGPSCPAAFARWWAEYQEKVMKAFPAGKGFLDSEGRQ